MSLQIRTHFSVPLPLLRIVSDGVPATTVRRHPTNQFCRNETAQWHSVALFVVGQTTDFLGKSPVDRPSSATGHFFRFEVIGDPTWRFSRKFKIPIELNFEKLVNLFQKKFIETDR